MPNTPVTPNPPGWPALTEGETAIVIARHAPARDRFHTDVLMEMYRVTRQRGWLTTDLVRSALILQEEAGEVSAGALQCTRSYATPDDLQALYHELVQLASVTIQMAVNVRATITEQRTKDGASTAPTGRAIVDDLTRSTLSSIINRPSPSPPSPPVPSSRIVRAVDRFFRKVTPKS